MHEGVPEEPRLEIVPTEKAPEVSRVPPEIAEKIIRHIEDEEREEMERERMIDDIIRRKKQ